MRLKTPTLTQAGFTEAVEPIQRWDKHVGDAWVYSVRIHEIDVEHYQVRGRMAPIENSSHKHLMVIEDFTDHSEFTDVIKFTYK